MLNQRNLRHLYEYLILRFVRPPAPPQGSLLQRLNNHPASVTSDMLISVDGNISSGKSSLVSKLVEYLTQLNTCYQNGTHQHGQSDGHGSTKATNGHGLASFDLEVIPEPLDKWCNLKGFNLLELFYKEPKKYNFVFQHYVQLTRLMDTVRTAANSNSNLPKIRIMERSLQNNRYCFLELARQSEQLQSAEFTVLTEWYSWLEANMDLRLDLVIYLRTTPEVAYERMMNRGRQEESTCPLSYLTALHESYEDWLTRDKVCQDSKLKNRQQVIVIDANQSREKVVADCIEELTKFLSSKRSINGAHKTDLSPQKCVDVCGE